MAIFKHRLLTILVFALLLRLGGGVIVSKQAFDRHGETGRFLFPDSTQLDALARNLLQKHEFVDNNNRRAWRTPAYSIMLAGLYAVSGNSIFTARLMTNLIDILNIVLVWWLAKTLFSNRAGMIAAGLATVYPFFVYFSNLILADVLGVTAMLLITCSTVKWGRASEQKHLAIWWSVAVGISLSFAIMVKAAFALVGIFVVTFLLIRMRKSLPESTCERRKTYYCMPVIILAFCAGMAPWWIRNYVVFDAFVPFSTMGGFTLYESNSEKADGGPNNEKIEFPWDWQSMNQALRTGRYLGGGETVEPGMSPTHIIYIIPGKPTLDLSPGLSTRHVEATACEIELFSDKLLKMEVMDWVKNNPWRFASLMPIKFFRTWNVMPNWSEAQSRFIKAASLCSYVPVMLLALLALWVYRSRWREVYLLVIPAIYIGCLHSVFMGSIRYRLPAMGCMIVLAAGGVEWGLRKALCVKREA